MSQTLAGKRDSSIANLSIGIGLIPRAPIFHPGILNRSVLPATAVSTVLPLLVKGGRAAKACCWSGLVSERDEPPAESTAGACRAGSGTRRERHEATSQGVAHFPLDPDYTVVGMVDSNKEWVVRQERGVQVSSARLTTGLLEVVMALDRGLGFDPPPPARDPAAMTTTRKG